MMKMKTRRDRKPLDVHCIDKIPLGRYIVLTMCSNNTRKRLFVSRTTDLSAYPELWSFFFFWPNHLKYNLNITATEVGYHGTRSGSSSADGGVWVENEHRVICHPATTHPEVHS